MQSLKKALNHGGTKRPKRDRSEAKRKHVQLATVDPASGRPSVRTVSFRGFMPSLVADGAGGGGTHEETCMLMFVTDLRAEKVRHMRQAESGGSAYVECCWWLDEAGVQFRIAGRAVLATADSSEPELRAACEVVWDRLKEQTRTTFTWPTPGGPVAGADDNSSGPTVSQGSPIRLADANFGLLVVIPEFVDELHSAGINAASDTSWRARPHRAPAAARAFGPLGILVRVGRSKRSVHDRGALTNPPMRTQVQQSP